MDAGAPPSAALAAGVLPGKFEDLYKAFEIVGHGAFSEVRRCKDRKTKQVRAVKVVKKTHPEFDQESLENEVAIMNLLEPSDGQQPHPNIIHSYGMFEGEDAYQIVMEFMVGGELFDIIIQRIEHRERKGDETTQPYTEAEAARVVMQIADAIAFCHRNGVVHRDLKPENVLIPDASGGDGGGGGNLFDSPLKIADFGLAAQFIDPETGEKIPLSQPCGTPDYVAPEVVAKPRKPYDNAVDIWSIGVITYILLAGFPPFTGDGPGEILRQVKNKAVDFSDMEWDSISEDAKSLIRDRMLVRDPKARITAEELLLHPWVMGKTAGTAPLGKAFANLKKFNARRKFRAAVKSLIATQRMSIFLQGLRKERMLNTLSELNVSAIDLLRKHFAAREREVPGAEPLTKGEFVTLLDVPELLESLGFAADAKVSNIETLYNVFENTGADGRSRLSLDNCLVGCILSVVKMSRKQKLAHIFSAFDKDDSGEIDNAEFAQMLDAMRGFIPGDDVEVDAEAIGAIFGELDADGSGQIDQAEFIQGVGQVSMVSRYLDEQERLRVQQRADVATSLGAVKSGLKEIDTQVAMTLADDYDRRTSEEAQSLMGKAEKKGAAGGGGGGSRCCVVS